MKKLHKIISIICFASCLLPHALDGEKATFPFKKKRKNQGLLSTSNQRSVDQLATVPKKNNIDFSSEIDTLDAVSTPDAGTQVTSPLTTMVAPPPRSKVQAESAADTTNIPQATIPVASPKTVIIPPSSDNAPTSVAIKNDATIKEKVEKEKPIQSTKNTPFRDSLQPTPVMITPSQMEKDLNDIADQVPSIEFHFENADLQNLVSQISEIFHVVFISDESISPLLAGSKTVSGNKISFKTQKPLSKKEAWNLFLSFLDLAGLTLVPEADPTFFRITTTEIAQRSPIRAFIGVDPKKLPDSDELIRYVYFVENNTMDAIKGIVDILRSSAAPFQVLQDSKAFILIDKAYNIKTLMQIVVELDKSTLPQTLSVIKLRRADADQVKALYDSISKTDENSPSRIFPTRKQPTSLYFPENTKIFSEPRTNTLILLGTQDAIKKIEDFITKHIDVDIDRPYSPLKVFHLQYADATTVAGIMTKVTAFGKLTPAGMVGGVRGEDKYLKNMTFTPDKNTNSIVVGGEFDDYTKAVVIMKQLDEPQPQVAVEVLIVDVTVNDQKQLGTQLRSKIPGIEGLVGPNVKFQTSGFNGSGIVDNTATAGLGVQQLLGNLITLATGVTVGTTVITLGADANGVWGIFNALEAVTNAQVVSNPFITATNNTPATVELGETRRIITANVVGGSGSPTMALGDDKATLKVDVTPTINSDGMISLKLHIDFNQFTDPNPSSGNKTTRAIDTNAILADKEVLALGGLIKNNIVEATTKVPILGDIPFLGWLFKNKNKVEIKDNLLILISVRILKPDAGGVGPFTQEKTNDFRNFIDSNTQPAERHDPINKMFFGQGQGENTVDNFLFKNQERPAEPTARQRRNRSQRRRDAKNKKATIATSAPLAKKQVIL